MKLQKISLAVAAAGLMLAAALPAAAVQTSASAATTITTNDPIPVSVKISTSAKASAASADAKIDARVSALNSLETRIGQMQKVSAEEKANLDSAIQNSISQMAALKAKIDSDTDEATLKADIQSITKGYRIYLLVMPQGRITAAADRAMTIVGLMNTLSGKLQTRITAAQTNGKDVTSLNASLADMNSKTSDANVQATAGISEIASLQPDNGDKTVYASNQAALKDARAKIKAATTDLKTARQDAGTIVKTLVSWSKVSAAASSTTMTTIDNK